MDRSSAANREGFVDKPVLTPRQRILKRTLDVMLGSLLLILCAPVLLLSLIALKLSSSETALYRQARSGEGGKIFWMFKFRTMTPEADQQEPQLISFRDEALHFAKEPDDPRITRLGKFLRRWSLDELPQLLNVLRGEMSLVGPRPELPSLVEYYSTAQRRRFAVPQGMTGWWQINGRPQDIAHKVEFDLYYLQHYSLWLDIWILLKTAGAVLGGRGAI